jgi:hypothetical protein
MSSVTVEIDVSQIVALAGSAAKARPVIARRMEYAMVRSTAAVERDAESAVPWDTGHLRRSITSVVTPRTGTLSEPVITGAVGTNLVYGPAVEYGLQPGQAFPPAGSLTGWMRRHNMDPADEYALRRHIYQFGTKAQPYLGPALDRNRRGIEREFQLAADRALKDVLSGRGRF